MFPAMDRFNSDGVEIAYETAGEGPPILLIHGFASTAHVNWRDTGWVKTLVDAGRQVVAFDHRGHGQSQKLYDPAQYSAPGMAEDARRLLDHLGIGRADVMGYSMGARVSAFLTLGHPGRVRRAVFAGLASRMITGVRSGEVIADGLEAASLAEVTDPSARAFRMFAEQTGSDLLSLAACMRSARPKITADALASIGVPVLVVAGERDDIAGTVDGLTAVIPGAKGVVLKGRNHMNAVGDKDFKQAVLAFLSAP
jgi:pimeloyl-ACP methyl ester carboxylesterase